MPDWPNQYVGFQDPGADREAEETWQRAIDGALANGALRLDETGLPFIRTLRGSCPRCGHEIDDLDVFSQVPMTMRPIGGADGPESMSAVTNMVCTCRGAHDGRREGDAGCGWAPDLRVRFSWGEEDGDGQ